MKKILVILLLAVCAFAILCGCEKETKYYAGEKVSPDDITRYESEIFTGESKPKETAPETEPQSETALSPENTLELDLSEKSEDPVVATNIYYWTPNGTRYHIFKDCGSLSRSKNILSGTIEEGMATGKSGLCKNCEKRISK